MRISLTKLVEARSLILESEKMYVTEWVRTSGMELVYILRTDGCKAAKERPHAPDATGQVDPALAAAA
jgi:hypothetical protein